MRKNSGVLVLGLLGAAGAFFLYPWYRNYRHQVQEGEQALNELHQFIAESSSLATLGDINIDPADVTLKKLNEVLQRPPHEILARPKNSKSIAMGWACGGDLCTVRTFFLAPSGGQVSPSAVPITLWISQDNLGKSFVGSIGGIHLGDSTEKLSRSVQKMATNCMTVRIGFPGIKIGTFAGSLRTTRSPAYSFSI